MAEVRKDVAALLLAAPAAGVTPPLLRVATAASLSGMAPAAAAAPQPASLAAPPQPAAVADPAAATVANEASAPEEEDGVFTMRKDLPQVAQYHSTASSTWSRRDSLELALEEDEARTPDSPSEPRRNSSGPLTMTGGWPAGLKLRPGLEMTSHRSLCGTTSDRPELKRGSQSSNVLGHSFGESFYSIASEASVAPQGFDYRIFMVDPNSMKHMIFDMCSLFVLGFDLLVIPYVLAWDMRFEGFLAWTAWSTCVFWTCDIIINFLTGFHAKGKLELRPGKVARNYLRTWFVPDLVVASCDWMSMAFMTVVEDTAASSSGSLKILRFAKVGRLLRIVALMRMMKFSRAIEDYVENQLSESYKVALKVSLLFIGMLFLNHWISCAWIAIGLAAPTDTDMRWVHTSWAMSDFIVHYLEADAVYQYVTAFHWSVAQFTLGAIEIPCTNTWERLFNISCLIIGLLFGSTLVSSLSATMVDFQMMKKDKTNRMRKLRQFLRENTVDRRLAVRVQQQAAERLGNKERLTEQDVSVLKVLSTTLRTELRFGIFQPHLLTHPLFRLWISTDVSFVQRLCKDSIDIMFLRPKDELFSTASRTDKAYFIASGSLNYIQDPEFSGRDEHMSCSVDQGTWLCEAALWCDWVHVGRAEAMTHAKIVYLNAVGLVEALKRHRRIRDITLEYCKHFHRTLVAATPPEWPTDLEVPRASWEEIVVSMDLEVQVTIGLLALESISAQIDKGWRWRNLPRGLGKLREEVISGRSTLMINRDGEAERVVSVVALCIKDEDDRMLVQLGKLERQQVQTSCQLPGSKQEQGENPNDTITRILAEKLAPLQGHFEVQGWEQSVQWKHSKEYNVNTKYLRTVCTSRLQGTVEAKKLVVKPNTLALPSPKPSGNDLPTSPRRSSIGSASDFPGPRRPSLGSASAHESVRPEFLSREVLVMHHKVGSKVFHAWLSDEEFEMLRQSTGEDELLAWLAALQRSANTVDSL